MQAPNTRLTDYLCAILVREGQPERADAVRKAADQYYNDPLLATIQLGSWLVDLHIVSVGELEEGLAMRGSEISLFQSLTPEEQHERIVRTLDRATSAIADAQAMTKGAKK